MLPALLLASHRRGTWSHPTRNTKRLGRTCILKRRGPCTMDLVLALVGLFKKRKRRKEEIRRWKEERFMKTDGNWIVNGTLDRALLVLTCVFACVLGCVFVCVRLCVYESVRALALKGERRGCNTQMKTVVSLSSTPTDDSHSPSNANGTRKEASVTQI